MLAQRYRKRPVEVDAVHVQDVLRAAQHHWSDLPDWIRDAYLAGTVVFLPNAVLITTAEGKMRAERDDWIIREPFPTSDRTLYPCKPDIFAATYEPALAPPAPTAAAVDDASTTPASPSPTVSTRPGQDTGEPPGPGEPAAG